MRSVARSTTARWRPTAPRGPRPGSPSCSECRHADLGCDLTTAPPSTGPPKLAEPAPSARYDRFQKEVFPGHSGHRAAGARRRTTRRRGTSALVRRARGSGHRRSRNRRRPGRGRRRRRSRPRGGARTRHRRRRRGAAVLRRPRVASAGPRPSANRRRGPCRARRRREAGTGSARPDPGRRSALARASVLGGGRQGAASGGPRRRRARQRPDSVGPARGGVGARDMTAVLVAVAIVLALVLAVAGASIRVLRDNVPAKVNAVAYFRVVDPVRSVVEVERYRAATSQIAQTTLRSVLGKADLDHLLGERERLNEHLQQIIDEQTDPWGIKVTTVEIKDVGIPSGMQRAMARQAEAERERRAKIINAEGEFQAAERLFDAALVI